MEAEIHIDLLAEPLVAVDDIGSDVKSERNDPTGRKDPSHFRKRSLGLTFVEMDDRVEADDTRKASARKRQIQHVADLKGNVWPQLASLINHGGGEIQSSDVGAVFGQEAAHMARATTELDDLASAYTLRKGRQKVAVEWLARQLTGDCLGVVPGYAIVARPGLILIKQ
jgi:hypothetical protein